MHDIFRRRIRVGDTVTYPTRKGSQCWTGVLRVTDLGDGRIGGYQPSGRHATIYGRTVGQVVVVRGGRRRGAIPELPGTTVEAT